MKSFVSDLQYCFDRYFRMSSTHVVLLGDLQYGKTLTDGALNFDEDIRQRLKTLINVVKHVEIYRSIDLNRSVVNQRCQDFLTLYCSTRDGFGFQVPLGQRNHTFKAKNAELKLRNKYHKILGLTCLHSTDKISKNI